MNFSRSHGCGGTYNKRINNLKCFPFSLLDLPLQFESNVVKTALGTAMTFLFTITWYCMYHIKAGLYIYSKGEIFIFTNYATITFC